MTSEAFILYPITPGYNKIKQNFVVIPTLYCNIKIPVDLLIVKIKCGTKENKIENV